MNPVPGCLACAHLGKACDVFTADRIARIEAAGPGGFCEALRTDTGRRVVVDGSKLIGWLRVVAEAGGLHAERVRVIVTSKDPFAFADSFMRRSKKPAWHAANIWRDTYFDILRTLNASRMLYVHVPYVGFATAPEDTLRQLCTVLGIDYRDDLLRFREEPVCSIGGNPGAQVWREGMLDALDGQSEWQKGIEKRHWETYRELGFSLSGWADTKWTERLDSSDLAQIAQTPGLSDLASILGYDLSSLAQLSRRP
jgi:hypothetical protein